MNRRLLTILVLAFAIAGICAFAVYRMIGNRLQAAQPAATTHVIAVNADIKLGAVLTAGNLAIIEIAGALPKGAILKPENAIGRGVLSDLYQGEPIIENRLAPPGSGGGLAATIPEGMRACAVRVDDVVGVAGFVTPGMRVDVLIAGLPPGNASTNARIADQGTLVKTLLQNIQVLSAGQDIQKDAEGKPHPVQVVNLLVTPEQAETLSLASNQTRIQLVLRNPLDTKIGVVPVTAMANLFTDQAPAPVKARPAAKAVFKAAPPPAFTIEVINGSKRSEKQFSTSEGQK
jgi:pilus assembly protein CpaB